MLHGQQPVLHITLPRLASDHTTHQHTSPYTWGGHPNFALGIDTTRETAVTGSKPLLDWRRALAPGVVLVGGRGFLISLDSLEVGCEM